MSRYVLLAIVAIAASVMNMVPWAGPVGRAASVIEQDPVEIWQHLLPIQGASIVVVFVIAGLLGWKETRRITKLRQSPDFVGHGTVDVNQIAADFITRQKEYQEEQGYTHRKATWVTVFNIVLSLALLATLVTGILPPAPAFLIGTALALLINFPSNQQQSQTLKRLSLIHI